MPNVKPTKQTLKLVEALKKRGLNIKTEHWDGHKHIDIYIPEAKMYIEVDGLQHYTNAKQIITDLRRDHYSDDAEFSTKHISNQLIESYSEEIADAIAKIVKVFKK